jgi:hypothetical protein
MNSKTLKTVGLLLVILAAAGWLYLTLRPDRIDVDPHARLGAGAASAIAKLLNNSGQVVLVDADYGSYQILAPTTEAEIKAFKKAIEKTPIKIAASERVSIAPPSVARAGVFMQPGQLSNLVVRHSDADAIVLFVGLAGPADLSGFSTNSKTRLIVVSNYEQYYTTLLKKRAIHMVIAPRPGAGDDGGKSVRSGEEWFGRHYMAATPDRVDELQQ